MSNFFKSFSFLFVAIAFSGCSTKGDERKNDRRECQSAPRIKICDLAGFAAKTGVDVSSIDQAPEDILYLHAVRLNSSALDRAEANYALTNPGCPGIRPESVQSTEAPPCPDISNITDDRLRGLKTALAIHRNAPNWWDMLPDCPCAQEQVPSTWSGGKAKQKYHPGAVMCYRSPQVEKKVLRAHGFNPDHMQPGQQCCFDKRKKLITKGPAAGTPDLFTPSADPKSSAHENVDVELFHILGSELYTLYWPPNNGRLCPENTAR